MGVGWLNNGCLIFYVSWAITIIINIEYNIKIETLDFILNDIIEIILQLQKILIII